jgi:hypothetical protein
MKYLAIKPTLVKFKVFAIIWVTPIVALGLPANAQLPVVRAQQQLQQQGQQQAREWQQQEIQRALKADNEDSIYAAELMTPQEKSEYRAAWRKLKTPTEREAFRQKHIQNMWQRAEEISGVPQEKPATDEISPTPLPP